MIEARFVEHIAHRVNAAPEQIVAAVGLLDGGATIPFVAHYRKDTTGGLSERQLERIHELNTYFTSLTDRRNAILQTLEQEGKLTDDARDRFLACADKHALEDLYLPYKKKGHLKSAQAREKGLQPLADYLLTQAPAEATIEEVASSYMNADRGVESVESALEGARHILGEHMAHDPDIRGLVRDALLNGQLSVQATKNAEDKKTKFEAFYNFSEPLSKVRSHRLLTISRGVRKGFLRMELLIDDEALKERLTRHVVREPGSPYEEFLKTVIDDAFKRHLRPAIENDVMALMREQAEVEAVGLLRENLEGILMAPPAGSIPVLAIQPTAGGACVVAVVDAQGDPQETAQIHPLPPQNDTEASMATLRDLADRHQVLAFAIANSPGSRDVARLVDQLVQGNDKQFSIFVNDAAARVYADSRLAAEELPALEPAARCAVSVARRLQDPLRELVKAEPRSLGVGQYQYEINPKTLRDAFTQTIISCVNRVRVDVNTAGSHLLRYISGVQFNTAQNLLQRRRESGPFTNRNELIQVNGIGPKVYEMAAGFLRIRDGENPLDNSAIHPEAYGAVERLAAELNLSVPQLIENPAALDGVDLTPYAADPVGPRALEDIRSILRNLTADPRPSFRVPSHKQLHSIDDLELGMDTEGVVTNVTDFGAFVDVGVYHDGLVHLSELANHFVRDPREIISVGEVVKVRVIGIDREHQRISLSRKALLAAPNQRPRRRDRAHDRDKQPEEGRQAQPPQSAPRRQPAGQQREEGATRPPRGKQHHKKDKDRKKQHAGPRPSHAPEQKEESLNTLLADQLLALRDKFSS
jgi:protein Tex